MSKENDNSYEYNYVLIYYTGIPAVVPDVAVDIRINGYNTVGQLIFEDIIFRGLSKICFRQKFSWINF